MSNILKYQNPSSPLLKPWKALEKMNYEAIPDSTFTRDKTGIGSIEYFSADNNNGITYLNGYHKAHPKPGTDVILYDPATNDQQDVRLDALHFMPKDPIYGALYDEYLLAARDGDVAYNADRLLQKYIDSDKLEQAFKTYDVKDINGLRERLFLNEADGLLRNMFIEGTPEYIKSKRYYPDKTQLEQWNAHLVPYINNIKTYLETGVKPEHVIEPAVVTAYKKGGRIHIKKKNRGKFTEYCGGKVTEECIAKGKNSKDPKIRKRATFAANARRWKHENGGILKYKNPATILDLPEGSAYGGELEPAVVKPAPLYGVLDTYYPVISKFPFTGHSELQIVDFGWDKPLTISKYGTDYDYNLVTNNCSDATRCAVEKIFGEKINPVLFTTPGDVQDFVAEKTGQKPVKEGVGQTSLEFNIPFATAMDLKNQNLDFYIQDYLHKAAKMKKQMKEENPNWNSDSFDLSTAEVIQRYKDQKYKFQPFKNKNGGILKAQEGTGNGFWSKLWNAVKAGGMAARDAKLGAVGAQQVRDLYSEGKNQEAQDLAKKYAKANTTGIALTGGAASTGLLGDLMVTGATTTADTFIDGDVDNFGKNFVKNAAGDLIGHGTSKLLTHLRTNELNKYIDYLNESRRQELFPKSENVYYHIDTDARPLFNTNAKLHPSKDVSRILPGFAREEGDIPYIWFNRRTTYGIPKHDRIVFGSKEDLHLKPIQETNLPHNEVEGFYVTEGYPNTDKIQMYRGYPISIGGTRPIYVFGKEIFYAPK